KLEILDISNNSIRMIPPGYFQGLQTLKQLNMEVNYLGNFDDFMGLGNLQNLTIYMSTRGIFRSPHSYNCKNVPQLKLLKSLTVIYKTDKYHDPCVMNTVSMFLLKMMENLEIFRAVNICIGLIFGNIFRFNPQLKSLTIAESNVSYLNTTFFHPIPNLQTLEISKSKIKSLDFLVHANLSSLKYLSLTDNEITVVDETIIQSLPSLTYLDLSNNLLNCECSNAAFIHWLKTNNQTQVVNAHQYTCSFPMEQRGSLFLDFDIQSCWDDSSFFYFIFNTCLVVLTLFTSFVHHFLRWHLTYTFQLFLAFVYDTRKRRNMDPHQFDAFVSYNVHDEDWVYREMLPVLEGKQGWRLCLHHRDFQPGKLCVHTI
ncbi:hypothetical protein XENOCAPTIV_027522, partial [Xenoophorus captivus]